MRLALGALDLTNGQKYVLDGSETPFPTVASARALLPAYAQGDDQGAMRDIVLAVIQKLQNKIHADTGVELNAFVSPRYARGRLLDDVWGLALLKPRTAGESDASYRLRLMAGFDGITPNNIRAAVRAVAATFNNAAVAFIEPATDGAFWSDGATSKWVSFWQPTNGRYWAYDPSNPNPTTGAYWVPGMGPGPYPPAANDAAQFWIYYQDGAGSDALTPHWGALSGDTLDSPADFWTDGVVDGGFWGFGAQPLEVQIVSEVEARRAFGIRWALFSDHNLRGAK